MNLNNLIKFFKSGKSDSDRRGYFIQVLLLVFLIIIPFHSVWVLPVIGHKLQPPELIFIFLFLAAALYVLRHPEKVWFSPIDIGVLAWLGINVLSGLHVGLSVSIFIELLGTLYLTLLYFTIRLTLGEHLIKNFPNYMALTATIAALIGITGWCFAAVGTGSPLVDEVSIMPLLGNVLGRAKGFTAGNNMLAHILMVGILVKAADCWHRDEFNRYSLMVLGIMLSGFALTFSKTGFILLIGLVLVWYLSNRQSRKLFTRLLTWMVVLVLFFLYNSITLFHPVRQGDPNINKIVSTFHARAYPVATVGSFDIMLTRYGIRFEACLIAFKESFPWGIGPGEFRNFSSRIEKEGVLKFRPGPNPEVLQVFPHSTYFGALAQLGVLGVLSILMLWGLIGYGCYQISQLEEYRGLGIGLSTCFISTAIVAITTDIMNFRHLWWLVALTAVLWHHAKKNQINTTSKPANLK